MAQWKKLPPNETGGHCLHATEVGLQCPQSAIVKVTCLKHRATVCYTGVFYADATSAAKIMFSSMTQHGSVANLLLAICFFGT